MKDRHARKSAPRTIMSKKEKKTPAFMKPRKHIFKRKEYRRARGAKIFGLTTSTGEQLICHVPSRLDAADWVRLVQRRVGPFMKAAFPTRGVPNEGIVHDTARRGKALPHGRRAVCHGSGWVARTAELASSIPRPEPAGTCLGWSEPHVRKAEAKSDTFERFKQRVSEICMKYTGAAKLVSSLEHRVALCKRRKGHNIGKVMAQHCL